MTELIVETLGQLAETDWQCERLSETVVPEADGHSLDVLFEIIEATILPRLVQFSAAGSEPLVLLVANGHIYRVESDPSVSVGMPIVMLACLQDLTSVSGNIEVAHLPVSHERLEGLSYCTVDSLRDALDPETLEDADAEEEWV